jgi:putative Mg2+ transporter-C (MgtC) family protein
MFVFPKLAAYLPREKRTITRLRIGYQDGRGLLRTILVACTELRFAIDHVDIERDGFAERIQEEAEDLADAEGVEIEQRQTSVVMLSMRVKGKRPVSHLIARLTTIDGVVRVGSVGEDSDLE